MILVSFSGGMDSTALLNRAVRRYGADNVRALSFDYGQRHVRELESAVAVAEFLGVERRTIDLKGLLAGSALVRAEDAPDVPEGHYAEASMKLTVVQGRNLLFASSAISATKPGDEVWLGVHAGDHFVYPDCRPAFVDPLAELARVAYEVEVEAPWMHHTKAEIAKFGTEEGAPLGLSWSCYKGGDIHCGRCGTCVERLGAFLEAGLPDPTEYEDTEFAPRVIAEWDAKEAEKARRSEAGWD